MRILSWLWKKQRRRVDLSLDEIIQHCNQIINEIHAKNAARLAIQTEMGIQPEATYGKCA